MERKESIKTINVISILIPLVVAILLSVRSKPYFGEWTKDLPHVIAIINTLTCVLLILGLVAIRKRNIVLHRRVMTAAFVLGGLFLICYVLYHLTNPSTPFGGKGWIKYFYYFILVSHILLSLVVLPLVLRSYYFAWIGNIAKHKKLVRYAFPIWLYVSITGVLAYVLILPYYV
jgi:putative membrane protein